MRHYYVTFRRRSVKKGPIDTPYNACRTVSYIVAICFTAKVGLLRQGLARVYLVNHRSILVGASALKCAYECR